MTAERAGVNANPADLGRVNRYRVLAAVARGRARTRASLAEVTGLTRPAISRIVTDLMAADLLVESDRRSLAPVGRPTAHLHLAPDRHLFVSVDLRLDGIHLQGRDLAGTVIAGTWAPLTASTPPERAVDAIEVGVAGIELAADRGVDGIGLSVGAAQDPTWSVVTESPYLPWSDVPLPELVAARFPRSRPHVRMADVAACAAMANWMELSATTPPGATPPDDLVHLQLGIGAGSGMVSRGTGLPLLHKRAEVGHLPLQLDGRICGCGLRGCFNAQAGFDALVAEAAPTGLQPEPGPDMISNYCAALTALVTSGDATAAQAIDTVAAWFARAAAMVINVARPTRFTYGGYPLLLGDAFHDRFRSRLDDFVHDLDTIMVTTSLGDDASAMGAHWLATSFLMSDEPTHRAAR